MTPVARPDRPTDDKTEQHAIAPVEPPAPELEPGEPPAAIVNHTTEELAREGARRTLERALAVEVDSLLPTRRIRLGPEVVREQRDSREIGAKASRRREIISAW